MSKLVTVRDLAPGHVFRLYTDYPDGARRPRLKYGKLFDFYRGVTVVEHRTGAVTIVRDTHGNTAPMCSTIRIIKENS